MPWEKGGSALALLLVLLGCGDASRGSTGSSARASSSASTKTIDVVAINALVPDDLKPAVSFDTRVVESTRESLKYGVAAPMGWTGGGDFARLSSVDGTLELERTPLLGCDDDCTEARAQSSFDRTLFKPALSGGGRVIKDEKSGGRRTLIVEEELSTEILVAWWAEGAHDYHSCTAHLQRKIAGAAAAFAAACSAVTVTPE